MNASHPARGTRSLLLVWSLTVLLVFPGIVPVHAAAPLDADREVKVVKAAYDNLVALYYTTPDTVALLTNAHDEAEKQLGVQQPMPPLGDGTKAQWQVFETNLRGLIASAGAKDLAQYDLAHSLVGSMTRTLGDKHTYWLNQTQSDDDRRRRTGDTSIVNYGIISVNVDGQAYVKQVVENSPAQTGGLRPADHLLALDGQPITWENRNTVLIAPQEGSVHMFTVLHAYDTAPATVTVTIRKYDRLALTYRVVNGHTGYIQTFQFFRGIADRFDEALAELHRQNVDSLIIDFRGNGGGYEVDRVAGRFVPQGTTIGKSLGRQTDEPFIAHANGKPQETLPIIVLMDESSGSASEITALALREFRNVTLVGSKTAGAVGSRIPAELGDGTLLAITISEYVSAKGSSFNRIGITPDVIVERTPQDVLAARDPQMDAALSTLASQMSPALAA